MRGQYAVYVTEPAANDIARSLAYIATELHNPRASAKLLADIAKRIRSLSSHPERFRMLPMSPWRERGYHSVSVRSHIIVYKVDAEGASVFVSRVFHSLQNWESMLDSLS